VVHHENKRAHTSLSDHDMNEIDVASPPYSTDLAPCNFWFPKMKLKPKEEIFNYVWEIQQNMHQILNGIMKEKIQSCFQWWQNHRV
jgi:hypothetical protein